MEFVFVALVIARENLLSGSQIDNISGMCGYLARLAIFNSSTGAQQSVGPCFMDSVRQNDCWGGGGGSG